jgi:hypothetical protein
MTDPSQLAGPHLTGQIFLSRMEYIRQFYGPASVRSVLEALSESDRMLLRAVHDQGWYPFGTLVRLDHAIAQILAPDDAEIFERLGADLFRHRTRWLVERSPAVSPHGFLLRVAEEHRRFHSFGRASYRRTGATEGELAFCAYPELDESFCRSSLGYLRRAVEFLTERPVAIAERLCQLRGEGACAYGVNWSIAPEIALHQGDPNRS